MKIWPWMLVIVTLAGTSVEAQEVEALGSFVRITLPGDFEPGAKVFRIELDTRFGPVRAGWTCDEPDQGRFGCFRLNRPNETQFALACPRSDGSPGRASPHSQRCVEAAPLDLRIEASDVEPETEWVWVDGRSEQRLLGRGVWRTVFTARITY